MPGRAASSDARRDPVISAGATLDVTVSHREELRAATRTAHERVDAAFARFDLTSPSGYRDFLLAHWSVVPVIEATLAASGIERLVDDWPARVRSAALAADIGAVGGVPVPYATPVGKLISDAAAFGVLYVLEGSRLGGSVLAKRVAANDDAACRAATTYLRHGERRGLWASFVARFDAAATVRDNRAEVIDAAEWTFDRFRIAAATSDAVVITRDLR